MVKQVDYLAYCTTFKAFDPEISDDICHALDESEGQWTPKLFRDEAGDGKVMAPSYDTVMGRRQVVSWHELNEGGEIIKRGEEWAYDVDPEATKYFIAGAFGIDELSVSGGVDPSVVEKLSALYKRCRTVGDKCLSTPLAADIGAWWQGKIRERAVTSERAKAAIKIKLETIGSRREYESAKSSFERSLLGVSKRSELEAKLASYKLALSSSPSTLSDYQKGIRLYKQMLGIVSSHRSEVSSERSRREKTEKISYYEAEAKRMLTVIDDEEPFGYSRFTDAVKASFRGMSSGSTLEERYCTAKNKYEAAKFILARLRQYNKNPCVEWKKESYCKRKFVNWRNPSSMLERCAEHGSRKVCVDYQYSSSRFEEEVLLRGAQEFCSTSCK